MKTIIKLLHTFGLWSQPYQNHKPWKPLWIIILPTLFLVGPEVAFFIRNHSSFTKATRAAIESVELTNVAIMAMNHLIHRSALEQSYKELQLALKIMSYDSHIDVQAALDQLKKIIRISSKVYITFQMIISIGYAMSIPMLTVYHFAKTGKLPPLYGIFEAE